MSHERTIWDDGFVVALQTIDKLVYFATPSQRATVANFRTVGEYVEEPCVY